MKRIVESSGYKREYFPFKYLGIPICSKRMTTLECKEVIEKMVRRINVWSSRNLSYMARLILVNSVLMSLNTYWSQISILPKKLFKEKNQKCRSFQWKGTSNFEGAGKLAWETICKKKAYGGLGVRDAILWNKGAIGKHVWAIANKNDSLFVKWINGVYIKGVDWWDYECPLNCSWYWKKVVAVKNEFKRKMAYHEFSQMPYTIKRGCEILQEEMTVEKVKWCKQVWERITMPKHRFMWWLVMQRRI